MPTLNYDFSQNADFNRALEQINDSARKLKDDAPGENKEVTNQINISGKKVVSSGGSEAFGGIDTSFKTIYNDLIMFRKVRHDDESDLSSGDLSDRMFRALDQPGHYYFKIFFYFDNPYSDPSNAFSSNLLGTKFSDEFNGTDELRDTKSGANTALSYLYNNLEYTRFNNLAEFIQLLSDISTKSPWYFQSISGLDQAIERTEVGEEFKIEEERKQITIKCLTDAYDNRIGRMLDLYRSVVYSQNLHKWILPSNLRKFDMGIYIFNSPIKTISGGRFGVAGKMSERSICTSFQEYYGDSRDSTVTVNGVSSEQMYLKPMPTDLETTGSKYIELRGCEIDYNSSKSAYSELDNAEGKGMEYEINIKYDSAAEDRYDPVFRRNIGDFVVEDLFLNIKGTDDLNTESPYKRISKDSVYVSGAIGDPFGARKQNGIVESLAGIGLGYLDTVMGKIMLGNMYGFSFGKIENILNSDPMNMIVKTGKEINNASLIAKRISDFVDPERGLRMLSGKTFRRPEDHQDIDEDISGNNMYRGWEVNTSGSVSGKSFRRPEDHQDIEEDISGKNFYRT